MWIWLDKYGRVKQYLTHGPSPVVGETDFQIFAYFDGLDTDYFDSATIKFRKPDQQGSVYPVLFMRKVDMIYEHMDSDGNVSLFDESHGPYTGFLFDFADFTEGDEIVRLLDTPGLWEATITCLGAPNKTNVSGLITFNVGDSAFDSENQTELSIDQILENLVLAQRILKKNSTAYMKITENLTSDAALGNLPVGTFSIGSIVFDLAKKKFYRILTVTLNPNDDTKVFATFDKVIDYVKIFSVSDNYTIEQIFYLDEGNVVMLKTESGFLTVYCVPNSQGYYFEIRDLVDDRLYRGNVPGGTSLKLATSDEYKVQAMVYIPHVNAEGDISWTNNYGEPNPETTNIKGPQGDKGDKGDKGENAVNAVYFQLNPNTGHLIMYYSTANTIENDIFLVNDNPNSPSYYGNLGVSADLVGHLVFRFIAQ